MYNHHRDDPRYTPTPSQQRQPRNANAVVIPHSLKTSLSSQIVLSEEQYTRALSDIIKRDFFPDLKRADELSSSINSWISGGGGGEGEGGEGEGGEGAGNGEASTRTRTRTQKHTSTQDKHMEYDYSHLTLEQFQSKFTSEDNASFSYQLHKANAQRRDRYRWAYDGELLANQRLIEGGASLQRQIDDVRGMLERGEQRLLADGHTNEAGPRAIDAYGGEGPSQALVRRDKKATRELELGVEKTGRDKALAPTSTKDTRPAGVQGWGSTALNNLMFTPDINRASYVQNTDREALNRERRVTNYGATRMKNVDDASASEVGSGSVATTAINAAANAPLDAHGNTAQSDLPTVRGYGFVENSPAPQAHSLPTSTVNKLMVTGTLASTPKRLDKEDEGDGVGDFKIPRLSRRDRLGQQLANAAGGKKSQEGTASTAVANTPRSTRAASLSPAGHALLAKTKKRRVEGDGAATPASVMRSTPVKRVNQSPDIRRIHRGWTPTPQR
ncbi:hypothetical protein E3P99_01171 [Wallemia hederae]|uniref:Nuclear protein Es2 n=1 Tax=Wallemia hederae TaxID=1540922 RepID=A0A4V4LTY0_9BASI|nr:hypothetical protein E3P99_01171 [Wallemia hederae]